MTAKTWFEMRGDTFDSREVIDRLAELRDQDELDDVERAELAILEELESDASGYMSDWQYGEAFIPDDSFEDHARELAEDIGAIDRNASWPLSYIDWEAAANALRMDYTSYEIDGLTYWARS